MVWLDWTTEDNGLLAFYNTSRPAQLPFGRWERATKIWFLIVHSGDSSCRSDKSLWTCLSAYRLWATIGFHSFQLSFINIRQRSLLKIIFIFICVIGLSGYGGGAVKAMAVKAKTKEIQLQITPWKSINIAIVDDLCQFRKEVTPSL